MTIPHLRRAAPDPDAPPIAPSRFASRLVTDIDAAAARDCRVALLGLPDDTGVELNGGRPGAAQGPAAIRAALARYGVADPHGWDWPPVLDAGDVIPADGRHEHALEETHRRVIEVARALASRGLTLVGLGGGHDLTFPLVRGAFEAVRSAKPKVLAGLYLDAHLDVRDTPGSGMAFRRLIEAGTVRDLRNLGCNPFANSRDHARWFLDHSGTFLPVPRTAAALARLIPSVPCFVSIDLDSIEAAAAPGVSAPSPAGLSPALAADVARAAGASPRVRTFDLMELCPALDPDGRTARLAAHLLLCFLRGFARRR